MEKYFYDTLGNRVRKELWHFGQWLGSATDYRYDERNRLVAIDGKDEEIAGTKPGPVALEYDNRGNLVKLASQDEILAEYGFDAANKLVRAVNRQGIVSTYTYDGLDRRVKVAVELPEAKLAGFKPDPFGEERVPRELREELGETYAELLAAPELKTEYEYAHDLTAPYNDPLMVYGRHNGSVQRYTHGLEVLAVDTWKNIAGNFQNQTPAGAPPKHERSYFLQNNLGSPMRLVDERGETRAYYSYDAFGKPVLAVTAGSRENRQGNIFSYTGYQYDAATGLHFAQARYYMPEVGRFVSEDPVAGWAVDPLSLNPYLYCSNSPFKYVDPSGLAGNPVKDKVEALKSKPDFYAGPNGEILPATGYRYMDSRHTAATMASKEAPLSFFGFEKFDTAAKARDKFQIFYEPGNPDSWSDARLIGEFDTLQLLDEKGNLLVRVPMEKGDRGSVPEPITRYYPEYGEGGVAQLVPKSRMTIKFKSVAVLPEN